MSVVEPEVLATTCARRLNDKQADEILMLNVEGLTSLADYFVIVSARNPRHLKALAQEVVDVLEGLHKEPLGEEGTPESGWILLDLGDVIVHLFDPPRRSLYSLEVLWGDATAEEWSGQEAAPPDPAQ